ncbi:MAG TPA: hypothetical protein VHA14_17230 [Bryobacteraceae bacterium]|nr:hypothetical protein [Bryobacteraceae bacterium]
MEKLKLFVGQPEVIAIRSLPGTIKPSSIPGRASDVMFTLVDGRTVFLPLSVADRIYAAKIQPGQAFEIRKESQHDYQLRMIGAANAVSPAPAAVAASVNTGIPTNRNGNTHTPAAPPPPPPADPDPPVGTSAPSTATRRLMGCFKMAIDSIAEAQDYARRKNVGITFTSEDVRAVAISCWIQCEKNGGCR